MKKKIFTLFLLILVLTNISIFAQDVKFFCDFSDWQKTIDFAEYKKTVGDYFIMKMTEGNGYCSQRFDEKKMLADSVGIDFSIYHFARPNRNLPEAEADYVAKIYKKKNLKCDIFLDFEEYISLNNGNIDYEACAEWCERFFIRLRKKIPNVDKKIYSSYTFLTYLQGKSYATLWLAAYPYNGNFVDFEAFYNGLPAKYKEKYFEVCDIWQFSSKYKNVKICDGYLDINAMKLN